MVQHGRFVCACPVKALDLNLHRCEQSDTLQETLQAVQIDSPQFVTLPGGGCVGDGKVALVCVGHLIVAFSGKLENYPTLVKEYEFYHSEEELNYGKHEKVADLIGHMYLILGAKLVTLLRGDHSYVVYDSRQVRVLAVRSKTSTQPLLQAYTSKDVLIVSTGCVDDPETWAHLPSSLNSLKDIPPCHFKYGWRSEPHRFASPPQAPGRTSKVEVVAAPHNSTCSEDGSSESIVIRKTRRGKRAGKNQAHRASSFDAARRGSFDADSGLVALVERRGSFDSRHVNLVSQSPSFPRRHSLDIQNLNRNPSASQVPEGSLDGRKWWRSSDTAGRGTTDFPHRGPSVSSSSIPSVTPEGPRSLKAPPLPTTPERGVAPWMQRSPFDGLAGPGFVYEEKLLYPQAVEAVRSQARSMPTSAAVWGQRFPSGQTYDQTRKTWTRSAQSVNIASSSSAGSASTAWDFKMRRSGRADAAWDDPCDTASSAAKANTFAPSTGSAATAWKETFCSSPFTPGTAWESTSAPSARRAAGPVQHPQRLDHTWESAMARTPDPGQTAETWEERAVANNIGRADAHCQASQAGGFLGNRDTAVQSKPSAGSDDLCGPPLAQRHAGARQGPGLNGAPALSEPPIQLHAKMLPVPGHPPQPCTPHPALPQVSPSLDPASFIAADVSSRVDNLPARSASGAASKASASQHGVLTHHPSKDLHPAHCPPGTFSEPHQGGTGGLPRSVLEPALPTLKLPARAPGLPLRGSMAGRRDVQGSSPQSPGGRIPPPMPVVGFSVLQSSHEAVHDLSGALGKGSGSSTPATGGAMSRGISRDGSDDSEALDSSAFGRAPVPLGSSIRRSMLSASLADLQRVGEDVDGDSIGADSDVDLSGTSPREPTERLRCNVHASPKRRATSHLNLGSLAYARRKSPQGPEHHQPTGAPSESAAQKVEDEEHGKLERQAVASDALATLPSKMLRSLAGPYRDDAGSAHMLKKLLYSSPCALTVADATHPDHPILHVNSMFEMATGWTAAEVLGKNCRFLQAPPGMPRTPSFASMSVRRALASGKSISTRILNYHKDGRAMWNDLSIVPIRNGEGNVTHLVGMQSFLPVDVPPEKRAVAAQKPPRTSSFGRTHSCTDVTFLDVNLLAPDLPVSPS
eukprot:jgi/Botrbrau1/1781/Bobra.0217s0036.1